MGQCFKADLKTQWLSESPDDFNFNTLKDFILSKYKESKDYKFVITKKVDEENPNYQKIGLNQKCIEKMLMFVPLDDLSRIMRSCKLFNQIGNTEHFWEKYYLHYFQRSKKEVVEKAKKKSWKLFFFDYYFPLQLIKYGNVKLEGEIGRGGSGAIVYRSTWKDNKKEVAFKVYKIKDVFQSEKSYSEFTKELSFLCCLRHPNVLRVYGCGLKTIRVGIVIEFCENRSIREYMKNVIAFNNEARELKKGEKAPKKLNTDEKLRILHEIAIGMSYIHKTGIIHKDLKGDNVLLDANFKVKIFDFGTSEWFYKERFRLGPRERVGTSVYMAPEVCLQKPYDFKIDVFAYGIMMFEIFSENFKPYGLQATQNIEMQVAMDPKLRPKINPKKFENKKWFMNLMKICWNANPKIRPTFSSIARKFKRQRNMKK